MSHQNGLSPSSLTRRSLLKLSAAAAAAALPLPESAADQPQQPARASARRVIFMVADGMSPGVPAMAEAFSRIVRGKGTHWRDLAQHAATTHGLLDMASADSLVTDSAAAASAWSIGRRINNWSLNYAPDGRPIDPVGRHVHEGGLALGLVTTTRITHATPASFAACAPKRDFEPDIAPQYMGRADILLGGGRKHFDPALRKDNRDLLAEYSQAGYATAFTRETLLQQPRGSRILGLFHNEHLPFTIDANRDQAAATPTLAEMTAFALESLDVLNPRGFLLQVEGGRVDHAAHSNDAAALLWDMLAFDNAVGVAQSYVAEHPDTLLIVTTDHGCGNPGLCGRGSRFHESNGLFEKLALSIASFEAMDDRLHADPKNPPTPEQVIETLHWGTGLEIRREDAQALVRVIAGDRSADINILEAGVSGITGQIVGNLHGVQWNCVTHTSDWVNLMAVGPGAASLGGLHLNTDVFDVLMHALGLDDRIGR